MRQNIARLLDLQGLLIGRVRFEGSRLLVPVRSPRRQAPCPRCRRSSQRIHQYHVRRVFHGRFGGTLVYLLVKKRRFRCRHCGKPFTESLPAIARHRRRSRHADEELLHTLRDRSFSAVARDHAIAPMTAVRRCTQTLRTQPIRWPTRGEIRIGVDGHTVMKTSAARTIYELRTHRLLTVLPGETKAPWVAFLRSIPPEVRMRIVEVSMDLEAGDAAAVREVLGPRVRVVADHFHVIKLANDLIDDVRRILHDPNHPVPRKIWLKNKENLSGREFEVLVRWGERYPKLFRLWVLKEDLRQVYEMRHKRIAAYRLEKVIAGYQEVPSGYARAFARTLKRWHDEILNFFDRRTSNGAVEGMHRKFKLIQRISYGFKRMDHYLAKIVLACVPFYLLTHHTNCY